MKLNLVLFVLTVATLGMAQPSGADFKPTVDAIPIGTMVVRPVKSPAEALQAIEISRYKSKSGRMKYEVNVLNLYLEALGSQITFTADDIFLTQNGTSLRIRDKKGQFDLILKKNSSGQFTRVEFSRMEFHQGLDESARVKAAFEVVKYRQNKKFGKFPIGPYRLERQSTLILEWQGSTYVATIYDKFAREVIQVSLGSMNPGYTYMNGEVHHLLFDRDSKDRIELKTRRNGSLDLVRLIKGKEDLSYHAPSSLNELRKQLPVDDRDCEAALRRF